MTIHPDFVCHHDEDRLVRNIDVELEGVHEKKRDSRNRIIRMGWDYEHPNNWAADIPIWIPLPELQGLGVFDNVSVNEFLRGQTIAPHIDSTAFGDIAILSLLSDTTMRFTSPTGEVRDFLLPRRSLAIMSGELRNRWRHETLPLESDRRISVVYRKRL